MVYIDEFSSAKLYVEKFSVTVTVISGNAFVENAKTAIKTYVSTKYNDVFINNNQVWISIIENTDRILPLVNTLDVYNIISKKHIQTIPFEISNITSDGILTKDYDLNSIPSFVKNKIDQNKAKKILPQSTVFLNDYDLIPIYDETRQTKREDFFSYEIEAGARYMHTKPYFGLGIFPTFTKDNFSITARLDLFSDTDMNLLEQWEDGFDIIERINIEYFYSNKSNKMHMYAGEIPNVSFGRGYLVKGFSNKFDYPMQRNFGFNLKYRIDSDFMNINIVIPSFREFENEGGMFGFHSSLFISHKFPLTIGIGAMIDLNQLSQAENIYNFTNQRMPRKKRQVTGAEFDFNLNLVKRMDLDVSLYGEFVGIWYPNDIYYIQTEDEPPYGDDKRWRKGTWGIMAPGVSVKLDNRYEFNFALNFNSAMHMPSYFNNNYLYNKSIYYKANSPLGFNSMKNIRLLTEQIEHLNQFAINEDKTEFLFPKEIYPLLQETFNSFPVYGFTGEFKFNYRDRVKFSASGSLYIQKTEVIDPGTYYSLEGLVSVQDNVIRYISFLDFYLYNMFFWGADDRDKFSYGVSMGFKLPASMSLILDLGQVYYDYSLNGDEYQMFNSGLTLGISL